MLSALSARHWRHIARPFLLAGWLPRDVVHALDFEPGGRQHGYVSDVRHVAGWAKSRLALWSDENGPVLSRSQRLQAQRERLLGEQSDRRSGALRAAQRSAAVDVAKRAAELRAIVAAALRRGC